MFDLPVEGVALVFAIDHFLDMGRTATNVVGNAVATSVITKWEGMLEVPEAADAARPHAPAHTPHHGTRGLDLRSEEHTSELQSLMRISYAVFCLKKKNKDTRLSLHVTQKTHDNTQ